MYLALVVVLSVVSTSCGRPENVAVGNLGLVGLDGRSVSPLNADAPAHVFLFVRGDCPISNRYAPEWQRIHSRFSPLGVRFWLVYPDPDEPLDSIKSHLKEFGHPGQPLRDPQHRFVARTGATVTPEVALFDRSGRMVYRGRIDDRYVDFGKTRAAPTRHDLIDALQATLHGGPIDAPTTRAVGCFIPGLRADQR